MLSARGVGSSDLRLGFDMFIGLGMGVPGVGSVVFGVAVGVVWAGCGGVSGDKDPSGEGSSVVTLVLGLEGVCGGCVSVNVVRVGCTLLLACRRSFGGRSILTVIPGWFFRTMWACSATKLRWAVNFITIISGRIPDMFLL